LTLQALHREAIGEDAVYALGQGVYGLDTARSRLAPGLRAFGLVARLVNQASCARAVAWAARGALTGWTGLAFTR
jgi:hypothetical protein